MRINKFLSTLGIASRRAIDKYIEEGRITVNGNTATTGMDINENDICLGIASAGDNIFSMLSKNPKKVIAIDLSLPQLYLLELKREIIRKFDYQEMILFFGVISRDNNKNTKKIIWYYN